MRSDLMKKGVDRIAHRALFRALGLTDEELARPIIGIVNAQNEVIPGHMHLDQIAEAVKAGIRMAGGTPLEFPAIGVCDGIAMNHEGMYYSLPSREHIADSVEIMANAHPFDGLVFIPNCDKIVPGMLMAALRLNLPAIFCSGGPMLPGRVNGKQVALTNAFEAPGAVRTGKMTQQEAQEIVEHSCPGCGSCAGMFTANSMNCLTELLGLGLPGNGTIGSCWPNMQVCESWTWCGRISAPGRLWTSGRSKMPWPPIWLWAVPPTPCSICPPSATRRGCNLTFGGSMG